MANYQRSVGDIDIRLGYQEDAFNAFEIAREHYVIALQLSITRKTGQNDAINALEALVELYSDNCFLDEDVVDITLSKGVTLEQMKQSKNFLLHLLQAVDKLEFRY